MFLVPVDLVCGFLVGFGITAWLNGHQRWGLVGLVALLTTFVMSPLLTPDSGGALGWAVALLGVFAWVMTFLLGVRNAPARAGGGWR